MTAVRVAGAARLQQGESLRFAFQRGAHSLEGFVLRWADGLYAFANSCPHWSVDLDYGIGDFYDAELDRIVCKNHGALSILRLASASGDPAPVIPSNASSSSRTARTRSCRCPEARHESLLCQKSGAVFTPANAFVGTT